MRVILFIVCSCFSIHAGPVLSQGIQPRGSKPVSNDSYQVNYTIKAHIDPVNGKVSGRMDVFVYNNDTLPISEVGFYQPLNAYQPGELLHKRYEMYDDSSWLELPVEEYPGITIDSLLYQLVPIDSTHSDGMSVRGSLYTPIPPQGKGHFIVTFTTRLAHSISKKRRNLYAGDWFPRFYCPRLDSSISLEDNGWFDGTGFTVSVQAQLTVDTLFSIVAPGEWKNLKKHLGLVPENNDSIFVRFREHGMKAVDGESYRPEFANGLKKYYFTQTGVSSFPLMVTDSLLYDYKKTDDRVLMTAYNNKGKFKWEHNAALLADSLLDHVNKQLGKAPFMHLTIVPVDTVLLMPFYQPLIAIPASVKKEKDMLTYLLYSIYRLYFPDYGGTVRDRAFNEGLAYYLTWQALDERGQDASSSLQRLEKKIKKGSLGKLYKKDSNAQFAFNRPVEILDSVIADDMNRLRKYITLRFRITPTYFKALSGILNDSLFANIVDEYSEKCLKGEGTISQFENLLSTFSKHIPAGCLKVFDEHTVFDFAIKNVVQSKSNNGVQTKATIVSNGNSWLPFSIIAISGNKADTSHISALDFIQQSSNTFSAEWHTKRGVDMIILDPFYNFPDTNRYDNYYLRSSKRIHISEPDELFIGCLPF